MTNQSEVLHNDYRILHNVSGAPKTTPDPGPANLLVSGDFALPISYLQKYDACLAFGVRTAKVL